MKNCSNCLKMQYGHIKGMLKLCKDCIRGGKDNLPDRVSIWRQFFTGKYDGWMPRKEMK